MKTATIPEKGLLDYHIFNMIRIEEAKQRDYW